jgi:predicted lipoprotein with Yx(FWY)xxD motif
MAGPQRGQNDMRKGLLIIVAAALALSPAAMSRETPGPAPTLTVKSSRFGKVLFDGRGYVLYAFTKDRRGRSACYGDCAKAWPVYYRKGAIVTGNGVRPKLVGTTKRRNGRRQITYAGRPLYHYAGDKKPRQILCQNVREFGGTWLVVRPNGKLVR